MAVVIGILVPLASIFLGSGELSYSMYARTEEARIDVTGIDGAGHRRAIAPTELAREARASVVPLLAGADHWRSTPRIGDLRAALPALAARACDQRLEGRDAQLVAVEITLQDRAREGAAVHSTQARATCAP